MFFLSFFIHCRIDYVHVITSYKLINFFVFFLGQVSIAHLFHSPEGLALVEVLDLGLIGGVVALSIVVGLYYFCRISFQFFLQLTLLDFRRRLLILRNIAFALARDLESLFILLLKFFTLLLLNDIQSFLFIFLDRLGDLLLCSLLLF